MKLVLTVKHSVAQNIALGANKRGEGFWKETVTLSTGVSTIWRSLHSLKSTMQSTASGHM